ncbi:MAG: glucosamine-6-phosphate deaminase [Spirochaetales bacterium]|uniref:Glucosamine-6-phosphate deaminase n=1 Tax=Candidatus Thalassospirochaeta sargassi TaxID=3119039 RepID=A0AAJ1ML50_9SPIO|nr:glucosamine-6-phosphate deaminase [Spirochaetales bacterium]
MNIVRCGNYDDASRQAYHHLLSRLRDNEKAVLGLPTGSTPLGLYRCMTQGYVNGDFDYSGITTFNIDEYAGMERNNPDSYYLFMQRKLFNGINVAEERRHIPSGLGNLEHNCLEYDRLMEAAGGIDILVLAVGANGHIGFNEPGTPFESTTHIIELTGRTRADNARFFKSPEDVPEQALTMGIKLMMNAREIIFIGTGKEKADAVRRMVNGPVTTDCPASVLQLHPNITLYLDSEAAGDL